MSLTIDDERTCPKVVDEAIGERCHCYGDDYGVCAAGHHVEPGTWVPLPPAIRAQYAENAIEYDIRHEGLTRTEVLARMKVQGLLDFDGADLILGSAVLSENDLMKARMHLELQEMGFQGKRVLNPGDFSL